MSFSKANELIHCNLIGLGRLGKSLTYALSKHPSIQINSLYTGPSSTTAQNISEELKLGQPIHDIELMQPSNILWLTVPDDQIAPLVEQLMHQPWLKPGTIVTHCSGALTSETLKPLAQQGCLIASIHPLKSFSGQSLTAKIFQDCYCVLEGMPKATEKLTFIFNMLGAQLIPINPEKKGLYHAAAVMASNYLITLADQSIQLFEQSGIDYIQAKKITEQLMISSINNLLEAKTPREALTGPLIRGDAQTIQAHLDHLKKNQTTCDLYCAAGMATLPLTELNRETLAIIFNALKNPTTS